MFFVVVYNRKTGLVEQLQRFADEAIDAAQAVRLALELRHAKKNGSLEIVTLQADRIESLWKTHSRYFQTPIELSKNL